MTDEETYSLIFSSLKHPTRRKILRMLRDSELTFSQILEILSIESGHLSYHLESLGDLVTHSSDGKYKLSSFGKATVELMAGVEEHTPPAASEIKRKAYKKPQGIFFLGIIFAILLSSVITAPYASAWWNLLQNKEMNVVNVRGDIHEESLFSDQYHTDLLTNITLIAVYPKAAAESSFDAFTAHLAFLVILNPNITDFICDDIRIVFRSSEQDREYFGLKSLSFSSGTLVDFYHASSQGGIAPFSANVSMAIQAGFWPPFPQDVSHLLYLTVQIETTPHVQLDGRIHYMDNSYSSIFVIFNMTKYVTTLYRFSFPMTVWVTYASSIVVAVAVSANLLNNRKRTKRAPL